MAARPEALAAEECAEVAVAPKTLLSPHVSKFRMEVKMAAEQHKPFHLRSSVGTWITHIARTGQAQSLAEAQETKDMAEDTCSEATTCDTSSP
mmetsp:Transcript_47120/g.119319  ORF Transcript_47120/g.119319 Transcript_47120/m.119319 type:complete len:93 (-) Transcript_47120:129-407(-)